MQVGLEFAGPGDLSRVEEGPYHHPGDLGPHSHPFETLSDLRWTLTLPDLPRIASVVPREGFANSPNAAVRGSEAVQAIATEDDVRVPTGNGEDRLPKIVRVAKVVFRESPGVFPHEIGPHLVVEDCPEQELVGALPIRPCATEIRQPPPADPALPAPLREEPVADSRVLLHNDHRPESKAASRITAPTASRTGQIMPGWRGAGTEGVRPGRGGSESRR